jgi:hypothetical protein
MSATTMPMLSIRLTVMMYSMASTDRSVNEDAKPQMIGALRSLSFDNFRD